MIRALIYRLIFPITGPFVLLLGMACTGKQVQSHLADGEIVVDGNPREWGGAQYFEADRFYMAVANTDEHLYVSLKARDTGLRRQIIGRGLVLWFDPGGGKHKHLGIRFPIGLMRDRGGLRRGGPGRGNAPDSLPESDFQARLLQSLQNLEILMPDNDFEERMPVTEAGGIEIGLDVVDDLVTYEIKIPLKSSEASPYAMTAIDGKVGIGLEMPAARGNRRGGLGGGRGGGGRGGGGLGATGEQRPGMARGAGVARANGGTSDFWKTVTLTR